MADAGTAPGGAQSVDRALLLLGVLGDAERPLTLSELAAGGGLSAPTAHRLVRSLVRYGYVRQEASRRYTLGPRLVYLGERAGRLLGGWAEPYLAELRDATGETTNLAVLDGDEIVYVTQAVSRHQMRMFTEPGRRVPPHGTAVGKALLADLPDAAVRAMLGRTGMPARTDATITDPDRLLEHLREVRIRGYAMDDGEQEAGVRCLGAAIPDAPSPMAVSVSGPASRITDSATGRFVPELRRIARAMSQALSSPAQRHGAADPADSR
ncbi:MAG: IclR family transcriptional regulator [Actinocatenispora sp.]